jgi:hypothetical protein
MRRLAHLPVSVSENRHYVRITSKSMENPQKFCVILLIFGHLFRYLKWFSTSPDLSIISIYVYTDICINMDPSIAKLVVK